MKCCQCKKSKATCKCSDCGEYYCENCCNVNDGICECIYPAPNIEGIQ